MKLLLFPLLFISFTASGQEDCTAKITNPFAPIQEISYFLSAQTSYVKECAEMEILDPILDPFRKQALALSLCQKNETCLEYLKEETSRVSGLEKTRYSKMPATALWGEMLMQSGRTRIAQPTLKDLPLPQDPELIFSQLKEQALKDSKLNQNEKLKFTCAALVAMIGPGKLKALSAIKATSNLNKINRTHDVEKLLNKNRLPPHVKDRFLKWSEEVEKKGLAEIKKSPGYHDEPLAGHPGWHSVRLNDGFRACYQIIVQNGLEILQVFSITNDHKNYCRK